MIFSFAMGRAGAWFLLTPVRNPSQFMRWRIVPHEFAMQRCNCWQLCVAPWNPLKPKASAIVEPPQRIKSPPRFDLPDIARRNFKMVITSAHIQPIVALIAGILILIMPRFLNLVVAIYLIFIGLAGLGLFKMLHT
jgi:hypothetical protein